MAKRRIIHIVFILLALYSHNANAINEIANDNKKSTLQFNSTDNNVIPSSNSTQTQSFITSSTEHYPPFPIDDRNDNYGKFS